MIPGRYRLSVFFIYKIIVRIFSLKHVFVTLSRVLSGHLKETILVQILAFSFMVLLLLVFSGEFLWKGLPHSIPLFGGSYSQLAGVVLFNYAYIVTVPSWLSEKQNGVPVNSTIWQASTLSSAIYIGTRCVVLYIYMFVI